MDSSDWTKLLILSTASWVSTDKSEEQQRCVVLMVLQRRSKSSTNGFLPDNTCRKILDYSVFMLHDRIV